ncbi:MAG: cytochrome c family protein [Thermoanaerobaculales bacterium]|nr:cytochrome c family protein [Thermoanaerobaculales bacterium]
MRIVRNLVLGVMIAGAAGVVLYAGDATDTTDSVPDMVTIGSIGHWFSAVDFPHSMHADITGDCESCHHHSDGEAIECSTCHEPAFDVTSPDVPPINVAYHLNCLTCHQETDAPTGCEDCHSRAALPEGPELKK